MFKKDECGRVFPNRDEELCLMMPAGRIPEGSAVSKPTGTAVYTLKHNLVVYLDDKDENGKKKTVKIDGLFMIGPRGGMEQVQSDRMLLWRVSVEDLHEMIDYSLDYDQYCPQ